VTKRGSRIGRTYCSDIQPRPLLFGGHS
jgi:hypothetical protein